MKIKTSLIGLFCILAWISLSTSVYAIKYNLDAMSIIVPHQLKVDYRITDSGKIYDIVYRNGNLFGMMGYANHNTDPTVFDKGLDNVKGTLSNYQEIKRGCDDGLLSINTNYCAVMYYGEDLQGNGLYYFQIETQVGEGLSATWTFADSTANGLGDKIPIAVQIVDSMEPHFTFSDGTN